MLTIRFTRIGKKNDIKFRLIVKEKRSKRDGAYVDQIGFYDPVAQPQKLQIDETKLKFWLQKGAQLSEGVKKSFSPEKLKTLLRPSKPSKTKKTITPTTKATPSAKTPAKKVVATSKSTSTTSQKTVKKSVSKK